MKSKMVIEYVDIQTIKSYSKNAKIHSKSQIEKIAKSIEKFGWKQNLVIDKDGVLEFTVNGTTWRRKTRRAKSFTAD